MRTLLRRVVPALVLASCAGLGTSPVRAEAVIVERAMPAPIVEVVPVQPGAGFAWVPGHWAWRGGGWFWVRGHYIQGIVPAMPAPVVEVVPVRPSPAHVWVKGHYVFEGGRWGWHPGLWLRL